MEFAHFGRLRDEVGVCRLGIFRLDLNHGLERLGAQQFFAEGQAGFHRLFRIVGPFGENGLKGRRKGSEVRPVELSVSCVLLIINAFSHFITSRFGSITSSNVMRDLSNVISFSQPICFSDALWSIPQTAKTDAFFDIAELFAYGNAQITIKVNVYISLQHKSRSRYGDGGDEKGQMGARTGHVLRFASPSHGTESAPGVRPEAKRSRDL